MKMFNDLSSYQLVNVMIVILVIICLLSFAVGLISGSLIEQHKHHRKKKNKDSIFKRLLEKINNKNKSYESKLMNLDLRPIAEQLREAFGDKEDDDPKEEDEWV